MNEYISLAYSLQDPKDICHSIGVKIELKKFNQYLLYILNEVYWKEFTKFFKINKGFEIMIYF